MTQATYAILAADNDLSTSKRTERAVTVIVLVTERPDDLVELYEEYAAPLRASGRPYDFLFVAEPWNRSLTEPLSELALRGEPVRVLHAGQTVGEAALLKLAVAQCKTPIVVTIPGYRRVAASAIVPLIAAVEEGSELVVARRWPRHDSWINRVQNWVFHQLLARLVGGNFRDVACGVRAMRREVLEDLPLYGDLFRFIPVLAYREGYRVVELDVPQHEADRRARAYRPGVYLRRLLDLLGLFFLVRFRDKPLRFFGLIGSGLGMGGGVILFTLFVQRLGGQGIADRPLLLLGVLLVVLGVQAVALGLVGEIIVHLHASRRTQYRVVGGTPRSIP